MSHYRVCKKTVGEFTFINSTEFDNKEDAEHYAKNQSVTNTDHEYIIQKNNDRGDFSTIKSYINGKMIE
jgi:hypothetical protein